MGVQNALSNWNSKYPDIQVLGINDSKSAQDEICIIEKKNIKVAILNYTYNHGNGDMLVYYSLGNYANWTSNTGTIAANCMLGSMAQVVLKKDAAGETVISEYAALPLVCHVSDKYEDIRVYPLDKYTKELSDKNAIRRQAPEFGLDFCRKLWSSQL